MRVKGAHPPCYRKSAYNLHWSLRVYGSALEDSTSLGSCSAVVFLIEEKKSEYKWTHVVQARVVQGSTVYYYFRYSLFYFFYYEPISILTILDGKASI